MRSFAILLLLLILSVTLVNAQTVEERLVRAEGYGETKEAALEDAYRVAVENAIGITVSARSIVENGRLIEDNIMTRSRGFIKSSKIIVDYDKVQQLVVIDAIVLLQDLRREFAAFDKIDMGAKIDGASIHADRTQRRAIFDKAILDGPDRVDGIMRILQRAISIDMEEPWFAPIPDKNNMLPYKFTFTQGINTVRYNRAIRQLDMMFSDLLADKTPYEIGDALASNEVVLFNIDDSATKYTFNYEQNEVLSSFSTLFVYLELMGKTPTFQTLFYDKSTNIVDRKVDDENRGKYFMVADRTLEPRFVGDEKITLSGSVDMDKLMDFDNLTIVSAFSTSDNLVQDTIGDYYYNLKDYKNAIEWYQKAAEQGNVESQNQLGLVYEYGYGVTKDYKQAFSWYQKAAEQGYSIAQTNLGLAYQYARGVSENYKQAAAWYRKAAEQGYARAQYRLGDMYYSGRGVIQDHKQAFSWYKKAAEQGYVSAQTDLGFMYEKGYGGAQDYKQALAWQHKAVEQGSARAQFRLGWMYGNGYGVTKDYNQAVSWYRKAADQGHDTAQNNLGVMYQNGYGVTKDYNQAIYWYKKAVAQGNELAKENLEELMDK